MKTGIEDIALGVLADGPKPARPVPPQPDPPPIPGPVQVDPPRGAPDSPETAPRQTETPANGPPRLQAPTIPAAVSTRWGRPDRWIATLGLLATVFAAILGAPCFVLGLFLSLTVVGILPGAALLGSSLGCCAVGLLGLILYQLARE